MKNIKIEGLDENNLDKLSIQYLTRIENGTNNPASKVATFESRQKGGLTNVETGHISNLGSTYGPAIGKKYGPKNGRKVGSSGLGAQTMKEKYSAPIIQMDMDGNVVKEWNSINDAKRAGYHGGHISNCCNNKKPQYKGYIWKFKY
jgi:hypothetical protein